MVAHFLGEGQVQHLETLYIFTVMIGYDKPHILYIFRYLVHIR